MEKITLEEYQVVEASLFVPKKKATMTIKNDGIVFNTNCLSLLENVVYIRLIMDTNNHRLFVQKTDETDENALRWCNIREEKRRPRKLSGKNFSVLLYEMMEWDVRFSYTLIATKIEMYGEEVLCFELDHNTTTIDYKINGIVNLLRKVEGVFIPDHNDETEQQIEKTEEKNKNTFSDINKNEKNKIKLVFGKPLKAYLCKSLNDLHYKVGEYVPV